MTSPTNPHLHFTSTDSQSSVPAITAPLPHTSPTLPSLRPRAHLTHTRVSSVPPVPKSRDLNAKGAAPGEGVGDPIAHLLRSEASIVKTRSGSVLSRGFILKTDHYPSGALLASIEWVWCLIFWDRTCIRSGDKCTRCTQLPCPAPNPHLPNFVTPTTPPFLFTPSPLLLLFLPIPIPLLSPNPSHSNHRSASSSHEPKCIRLCPAAHARPARYSLRATLSAAGCLRFTFSAPRSRSRTRNLVLYA